MNRIIDLAGKVRADMSILALGPVLFGDQDTIISYMKGKYCKKATNTIGYKITDNKSHHT